MKRGEKKGEKRNLKELLKNNFVSLLLLTVICMAFVLAGDVIVKEGAMTMTGNATADYFFGDGSQLTNLPAGGNASWNESYADTLYCTLTGCTILGTTTFDNNILVGTNINHKGDEDTYIQFSTDTLNFWTGNINFISLLEDTIDKILLRGDVLEVDIDNSTFTGNITADYFIGDGSELTNITGQEFDGICGYYIDTYEGNDTNNREIDLGDDYDEIVITLEENKGGTDNHLVEARATRTTYSKEFRYSNTHYHSSGTNANDYFQGKMTGGDVNKIKLGTDGSALAGANANGWTYRIIAKKYCDGITHLINSNLNVSGDVEIGGDLVVGGEGGALCKVLIDTYEGNGNNNREIDLGDDYDEVHIYLNVSRASGSNNFMSHAWAIRSSYGILEDNTAARAYAYVMASADGDWQGKMTGADANKIKTGNDGSRVYGTNYNGRVYRIIAKKYCSVESLPLA